MRLENLVERKNADPYLGVVTRANEEQRIRCRLHMMANDDDADGGDKRERAAREKWNVWFTLFGDNNLIFCTQRNMKNGILCVAYTTGCWPVLGSKRSRATYRNHFSVLNWMERGREGGWLGAQIAAVAIATTEIIYGYVHISRTSHSENIQFPLALSLSFFRRLSLNWRPHISRLHF